VWYTKHVLDHWGENESRGIQPSNSTAVQTVYFGCSDVYRRRDWRLMSTATMCLSVDIISVSVFITYFRYRSCSAISHAPVAVDRTDAAMRCRWRRRQRRSDVCLFVCDPRRLTSDVCWTQTQQPRTTMRSGASIHIPGGRSSRPVKITGRSFVKHVDKNSHYFYWANCTLSKTPIVYWAICTQRKRG